MPAAIGSFPALSSLLAWPTDHLTDAADSWAPIADRFEQVFTRVWQDSLTVDWEANAAEALRARTNADRATVSGLSDHLLEAATLARAGASDLVAARSRVRYAVDDAHAAGFDVEEDLTVTDDGAGLTAAERELRQAHAEAFADRIAHRATQLVALDQQVAARVSTALDGVASTTFAERPAIQPVDSHGETDSPIAQGELDADRRNNQREAFRRVFGRDPVSAIDWATAAALDPHSYDPRYSGVGPQIRVATIDPVPGQGLVRTSQWIEQRDVTSFPFWKRDFGNERVANPNFDPGDTKVTTYIDYQNGIVVMRQNPSVELNPQGGPGRVKVGAPEGRVWQNNDGSVRIQYRAANPFVPGVFAHPPVPFADHSPTVNGDLVFTPHAGGVRVDGTRTDYPSLEVYQDFPTGQTHRVYLDPAQSGRSWGPMLNLEFHHEIGRGGGAFAPFDDWSGEAPVRPKPSAPLGPVTHPPAVPHPPLLRVPG